ncbi:hypothetical protein [Streptomyces sp. NPDC001480]|uniref:hypothetical protein n=1 Tax=Streptomyces sp. NPDC001480 TaxID=3364577 RepID=UPI0036B8E027
MVAQVLSRALPTCVVVTFTDELSVRQGHLDLDALSHALGVPVLPVVGHRGLVHGCTCRTSRGHAGCCT